jgi:hypothetical protein
LLRQIVAVKDCRHRTGLLQSFLGRFIRCPHLALEVITEHVYAVSLSRSIASSSQSRLKMRRLVPGHEIENLGNKA